MLNADLNGTQSQSLKRLLFSLSNSHLLGSIIRHSEHLNMRNSWILHIKQHETFMLESV